ncbi:peptidyl-prolyl cis-trans isomerase CYP57 isoform X1 [Ipomoea triloba]|uniref:peptidyl-prolyl cis-trans isomerase CYP57 isoform X1 n=1 Tax=Ipomoea triloba TaxID=35885 RepID=UPI00125DC4FE|nr:peptidyl-prolyl cis-trans isomerase CYP57 isoform X1 [Ipomoea triloba]GLL37982.1 peptidyl-prolyl cis-trans isomerase CYP57 isoform X1 [Ipomoea trifida]
MSTVYVLEPPTKGKVILKTTYGPLDIELWPKEAPKAVRNFVQLCLEGYYDNTIFHRIIKSYLIQGGDPTGTGTGGESIYGGVFPDEFHSRLRFKHRGLVACAGAGSPNTNGSQFFITLDKCDFLDKKHTIFGKITGDSIYNLLSLGEVETEKDDRPLDPAPKILSVEVLWNPFDDIVPRVTTTRALASSADTDKKDKNQKPKKNLNLLSFGEEAEEEEKELATINVRIRSSHDVLDDPRLLKEENADEVLKLSEKKTARDVQSVKEALRSKKDEVSRESEARSPESHTESDDDDDANFDARMRRQILEKRKELGDMPTKLKSSNENSKAKIRSASPSRSAEESDAQPKVEKLFIKKKGIGSDAKAERMATADADLQLLSGAERERQLLKQKKRRRHGQEDEILAKLEKFKASISKKPNASNGENEGEKGEDLSDWASVKLKFTPEPAKNNMSRSNDPNDYVVHDPLWEKGKEKFNKMQAKQKRREREWAGKSIT